MTGVHFLFVHGWGLDPGFWSPLHHQLKHCLQDADAHYSFVDLGFFGPEILPEPHAPERCLVAVGHSLGFAWILRHMVGQADALVSLGGFARFDVPAGPVRAMRRGLGSRAGQVLTGFHNACALPAHLAPTLSRAIPERLSQGLDWLLDWDASQELRAWSGPLLAVACEDDAIVSPALSRRSFERGLTMLPEGGHAFAATQAHTCARLIAAFTERL